MNITDTIAGRDLEARRAAIAGQVFVPGEVGYDQARQAWNLAVDERPGVVVAAESAPTWPRRSGTSAPTAGLRPAVGARPAPGQDRGACPFAVGGRFGDDRLAGPTWWSRRRALP